jgi:transposase
LRVQEAPGKSERPPSDRVKTDRRDAERLLRLLMIGGLHPVRVPTPGEEALRDLVRAREDVRGDLMRARHRLSKLLLRHDVRFEGGAWTQHHRRWLAGVDLGERGAQVTLSDYLGAIDALIVRRDSLEATIGELVPDSPWAQTVARLRCLRGIDTLSAVGLCAEVGDFGRFARAGHVMSFLGLVPSEHSSGQTRRQGQITKSGSGHGRRLLVERPGTTAEPRPRARRSSAARPARAPTCSRSPGRPNSACTAAGSASTPSAASAARSSRSPSRASSPASAGPPPTPTDPASTRRSRRRREPSGTHARGHPRSYYEHRFRRPRSILDSGSSRRNPVLRPPGSAHISLTARRAPAGPAAPLTDHVARPSRGHPVLPA